MEFAELAERLGSVSAQRERKRRLVMEKTEKDQILVYDKVRHLMFLQEDGVQWVAAPSQPTCR